MGMKEAETILAQWRQLERELETDPYLVDALLTVSEPDDAGSQQR